MLWQEAFSCGSSFLLWQEAFSCGSSFLLWAPQFFLRDPLAAYLYTNLDGESVEEMLTDLSGHKRRKKVQGPDHECE